jgi:hypothetical protein
MAALAILLTEFNDTDNKRTYTLATHSVSKPSLLIQSRKVPTAGRPSAECNLQIVQGTFDSAGAPLPQKINFAFTGRYDGSGVSADLDLAITNFRALVASDEFVTAIKAQTYVKA